MAVSWADALRRLILQAAGPPPPAVDDCAGPHDGHDGCDAAIEAALARAVCMLQRLSEQVAALKTQAERQCSDKVDMLTVVMVAVITAFSMHAIGLLSRMAYATVKYATWALVPAVLIVWWYPYPFANLVGKTVRNLFWYTMGGQWPDIPLDVPPLWT